ncbi:MAG: hypothetical protein K8R92_08600 [Planctomycetes bacterium]|nr:hypothetical protein [Planctomycetota bacterium]
MRRAILFLTALLVGSGTLCAADADQPRAVFGSQRASDFLRDLHMGADSLDIVTIGDSNAGYPNSGGWNLGLINACLGKGFLPYASPLMVVMGNDHQSRSNGTSFGWTHATLSPSGKLLSGAAHGPDQINAHYLPRSTMHPGGAAGMDWAYVAPGSSCQAQDWSNYAVSPAHGSWCEPGTPLIYRVVFPTFPNGNGSLQPSVWNATTHELVAQAELTGTNTGRYSLDTVETPFVMPASSYVVAGWNYSNPAVGPAGAVYESVYRLRKGFSGTNIYYNGGSTVATMAQDITGAGSSFWNFYFGEILARQKAAGGSGRVLIWVNGGINGPSSYLQWTGGMEQIIDAITCGFAQAGGDIDNLAFLCSVTHPTNAPPLAGAESILSEVRMRAEAWPDTMQPGVTYLNLEKIISATDADAENFYAGNGNNQAHLNESGYLAYSTGILSRLLDYPGQPCPSDLDGSGEVDGGDLGMILLDFGPCLGCVTDLDGSGEVDGGDIGSLLLDFGPCQRTKSRPRERETLPRAGVHREH